MDSKTDANAQRPRDDTNAEADDPPAPRAEEAGVGDPDRPQASRLEGLRAALHLLLPLRAKRPVPSAAAFSRAIPWMVPVGMAIGLAWVGVFRVTWRIYGEIGSVRVVPALAVVLLECMVTGPLLVLGLARTIQTVAAPRVAKAVSPKPESETDDALSSFGMLALMLIVLTEWTMVASIPFVTPWWPSPSDWRHHFNFVYPAPIYRAILLAPIWGRWGLLVAATTGRTAGHADEQTNAFCQAMRPMRLLWHAILPLLLTAVYCSREGNFLIGVGLSMLVFAATYLASVAMARRGGGQTRQSIYAAGQIAQLAFLVFYRAFWPLVHQ